MKYILIPGLIILISSCREERMPEPVSREYGRGLVLETESVYEQIPDCTLPYVTFKNEAETSFMLPLPKAGNQGCMGSCVSFAAGYGIMSYYIASELGNYNYNNDILRSPKFIHNQVYHSSGCDNANIVWDLGIVSTGGVLGLLKNKGVCSWNEMPYVPSFSTNGSTECPATCDEVPSASVSQSASVYKISKYEKVKSKIRDIRYLKGLLQQHYPILIAINVNQNLQNCNLGKDTMLSEATDLGNYVGGHALVVKGYDDNKGPNGAFRILNSWGSCLNNGEFWIDYNYFGNVVKQAYVLYYGSSSIKISDHTLEWDYPLNQASCISDNGGATFTASSYVVTLHYNQFTFSPYLNNYVLHCQWTTYDGITGGRSWLPDDPDLTINFFDGTIRIDNRCMAFGGRPYTDLKYWITTGDGRYSNDYFVRADAPPGAFKNEGVTDMNIGSVKK
ncbi:MAG: C1 family peptidase [Chitinophagales bacterium]|nr:C1 family peptidase [Chitinophagales bacterium]